ncbi:ABC transporter permease [Nocardioides gilvus]|uniref:ABC transporter permease n=1 Tax=Nocardioides gilvus TaxID=1735589 RepID=UPI000D74502C|nr:ABC transporter permease [Nocardioides gilvus]
MRAALVSEFRKTVSTPLWWVLGLTAFGYMAMTAGLLGFATTMPVEQGGMEMTGGGVDVARSLYSLPVSLGYVFPLVTGALAVTTEFRHRTLTATLLAEPNRTTVIASKLVVQGGVGAFLGLCGVAGAMVAAAGALVIAGEPTMLGEPSVWGTAALAVVALALWGMVGVGFGALVPNQVASIVLILAFTQLIEPLLRIGLALLGDGFAQVGLYFPGAAAEALSGASLYSSIGAAELLPQWAGGVVMTAYALGFALLGRLLTFRRDVT